MTVKIKRYIRDGRAPIPSKSITSVIMSRIRAKNTKPELLARKILMRAGLKGFKLHYAKVPGRPDIAFPTKKCAIFVHGCYWHRCPHCSPTFPKTHKKFWQDKFTKNMKRDKLNQKLLHKSGWSVITFWECKIKVANVSLIKRVKKILVQNSM